MVERHAISKSFSHLFDEHNLLRWFLDVFSVDFSFGTCLKPTLERDNKTLCFSYVTYWVEIYSEVETDNENLRQAEMFK